MLEFILDLISMFIFMIFFIFAVLVLSKQYCKKKRKRKCLKEIEKVELKLMDILKGFFKFIFLFIQITVCVILAIAMKPFIYKLNEPLGWGYATFASYFIAILLWFIVSRNFPFSITKKTKAQLKGGKKINGI